SGVRLSDPGTMQNQVQGNLIGTDRSGTTAIPNGEDGVRVSDGAAKNLIGGTGKTAPNSGQGNLISGNLGAGVDLRGNGTLGNDIQGNFIGTDVSGAKPLGNAYGVYIESGATANTVGGARLGAGKGLGNLISANTSYGVVM